MRIFHYFLLLAALTATTGCDKDDSYYPAPEFEGDPTSGYISIDPNYDFETMISKEIPNSYWFYNYFCFCNASDHKIYATLTCDQGGEYVSYISGVIDPGQKFTGVFATFKSVEGWGLITSFTPRITKMEVYYDVELGPKFPSGLEEQYTDFTQRFKTRQICDPGQWIYEEFTPRRARWTYILTNEDYERAKMMSEARD